MIYGLVMKCEACGELVMEKLENVPHTIQGNKVIIHDGYICGGCIARNQIEILRRVNNAFQ